MRRGEIRWYKFKAPDKRRPVLILSRDSILAVLGEVTIAPITSTVRDIPSEVFLSKYDGMPKDCAINFDYIHIFFYLVKCGVLALLILFLLPFVIKTITIRDLPSDRKLIICIYLRSTFT